MPVPLKFEPGALGVSTRRLADELAVMVDSFKPLQVTEEVLKFNDGKYRNSRVE